MKTLNSFRNACGVLAALAITHAPFGAAQAATWIGGAAGASTDDVNWAPAAPSATEVASSPTAPP